MSLSSIFTLILTFVCCLVSNEGLCQDVKHTVIPLGKEEGINGLIKTQYYYCKRNFLWMASEYGIERYDGNKVLNIKGIPNFSSNSHILKIYETKDSMLTLIKGFKSTHLNPLNIESIYFIQPQTGKIISNSSYLQSKIPFEFEDVISVSESHSVLYFLLKSGDIFKFDGKFSWFKKALLDRDSKYFFPSWLINKKQQFCALKNIADSTSNKNAKISFLACYDFEEKKTKKVPIPHIDGLLTQSKDGVYQVMNYANSSNNNPFNLTYIDEDLNLINQFSKNFFSTLSKTKRSNGLCELEIEAGIEFSSIAGKALDTLRHSDLVRLTGGLKNIVKFSFENANFSCLQTNKGPYIISSQISPFNNYLSAEHQQPVSARGISTNKKGEIFVVSGANIYIIDPDSGRHSKIDLKENLSMPYISFYETYYDEDANLLWLTNFGRLISYNTKNQQISSYPVPNQFDILKLVKINENRKLIIATKKGLYQFNQDSDEITPLIIQDNNHPINHKEITYVKNDSKSTLLATASHLYQWSILKNEIEVFKKIPDTLANAQIFDFCFVENNVTWLATSGLGVARWDMQKDELTFYNKDDGLSSNVAYSIQNGVDGKFWISTNFGLNALNPETFKNEVYLMEDGLPMYEFNTNSFHQDNNGKIYLGGLNGIISFDPDEVSILKKEDPQTYISEIVIKSPNSEESIDPVYNNQDIILNSNETLTVNFSSPNITSTLPIMYQYKIEGANDAWLNNASESLSLGSLGPGRYILKIRGRGIHKNWSSNEAILPFQVPLPFYLSLWFYFTVFSLIGIASYTYSRRRIVALEKTRLTLEKEVNDRTQSIKASKEVIEKQAEGLKQLDKLKSQFFTNVSHELRTPLSLIYNPINELRNAPKDHPIDTNHVETIYAGSQQLNEIVQKILKLAKYDTGTFKIEEREVTLEEINLRAIQPMNSLAAHNEIKIKFELKSPSLGRVTIDLEKVAECIENIISNAIRFSPNNKTIAIELGHQNGNLVFKCTDNGIGMTKEEISNIFAIYYQGDKKGLPEQGGLGIGLSLVSTYVKLMNGDISVESKPKKGSTFTLNIPCAYQDPSSYKNDETFTYSKESSISSTLKLDSNSKPNILIIEDNPLMNKLIQSILSPQYNVLSTKNGKEALSFLNKNKDVVDLILTDWMMPIMDGHTFFQEVKTKKGLENIPIIILSARASDTDRIHSLRIGIDDYLTKPFNTDELKIRIENLLNLSKDRKEILSNLNIENESNLTENKSADEIWLENLKKTTIASSSDLQFNVTHMAGTMNLSQRQLSRKVKQLTGMTPGNYIKEIRLLKARNLLESKAFNTVAEICFQCGFTTPNYFTKLYSERFGKYPSEYLQNKQPED